MYDNIMNAFEIKSKLQIYGTDFAHHQLQSWPINLFIALMPADYVNTLGRMHKS